MVDRANVTSSSDEGLGVEERMDSAFLKKEKRLERNESKGELMLRSSSQPDLSK
jgi:hypothetical protein